MSRRRELAGPVLLTAMWLLTIWLINPSGNFPINDDWSYGLTVKHWLETGEFKPGGWTSMTLWSHAAWGLLFSKLMGFSFETLRTSMLVMGALGVLGTHALVKQAGGSAKQALLCALVLGFNPIYLDLSFSFMTDVSFIAMTTWATYFSLRFIQGSRMLDWWCALVLGLAAVLCRQLGLCVFMGLALGVLFKHGLSSRKNLVLALLPLLIGAALLASFNHWLAASGRTPALYYLKEKNFGDLIVHPLRTAKVIGHNVLIALMYAGLFLAPVLLWSRAWLRRLDAPDANRLHRVTWSIGWGAMTAALLFMAGLGMMPVGGNGMDATGVGVLTLHDALTLRLPHVQPLPTWWWVLVSATTLVGVMMLSRWLAWCVITDVQQWQQTGPSTALATRLTLLTNALAYCAPLLVLPSFYDRYVLMLMPLLMAALVDKALTSHQGQPSRPGWVPFEHAAAFSVLVFLGMLAVGGTRDHLSWNRARWQAIDELQASLNPPLQEIDGGFEFNGMNFYDANYTRQEGTSWWRTNQEKYLITFGPIKGTTIVKQYPYTRWLPATSTGIFVLQLATPAMPVKAEGAE